MECIIKGKNIVLIIPATNDGKFRFKKRKNRLDFGEIFSTRECPFDEQTYLEWQIGYDVPIKDVEDGKKETKLTSKHFVGSNGKTKYPYELSEIFYKAMELELITKKEVENLLNEIRGYKSFIDEKAITVELDCTPETGHKRLGGFGTDWYFDTKKGWCHESETEVQ